MTSVHRKRVWLSLVAVLACAPSDEKVSATSSVEPRIILLTAIASKRGVKVSQLDPSALNVQVDTSAVDGKVVYHRATYSDPQFVDSHWEAFALSTGDNTILLEEGKGASAILRTLPTAAHDQLVQACAEAIAFGGLSRNARQLAQLVRDSLLGGGGLDQQRERLRPLAPVVQSEGSVPVVLLWMSEGVVARRYRCTKRDGASDLVAVDSVPIVGAFAPKGV